MSAIIPNEIPDTLDMDIKNTLHTLHTYRDDKECALEDMIGDDEGEDERE